MLELFAKHNSSILGLGEVLCFKSKTFVKPSKFLDLYLEYALVVVAWFGDYIPCLCCCLGY
jgi:hypothetical protein